MDHQDILNSLRSYDPTFVEDKVISAIEFAVKYHGTHYNEMDRQFHYNPLDLARIIIAMYLDSNSVIAALLHDAIDDTDLTLEEIQKNFGEEVSMLVQNVSKLSKINFFPHQMNYAENFRKLLVAMSDDLRVLIIKLAERLYAIRTINSIKSSEKRRQLALEIMEIYAPLAERIGMQQIKVELQDLCFQVLQPEVRKSIINRLNIFFKDENYSIDKIIKEIEDHCKRHNLKAEIFGRSKTPYSIWMKMRRKKVGVEELSDIIAFRIIVDTIPDCYKALCSIHDQYQTADGSFHDFISSPKDNNYQSLHTVIIGPLQQKIEIQIRTNKMHEVAELGIAAHWRYKQNHNSVEDWKQYKWMQELLIILEQTNDTENFLRNTKLAMYYDQVFCFTPNGKLITLPKDATPVDFAFEVHSDIGYHCVGAKIHGKVVPLKCKLKTGDHVEIITSKKQTPSLLWEKFVVTGKARSSIRKFVQSQKKERHIKLGQSIVERLFRGKSVTNKIQKLKEISIFLKYNDLESLYCAIGEENIKPEEIIKHIESGSINLAITNQLSNNREVVEQMENAENAICFDVHDDLAFEYVDKQFLSSNKNITHAIDLPPTLTTKFVECYNPSLEGLIERVADENNDSIIIHSSDCDVISHPPQSINKIILTGDRDKITQPFICRLKIIMSNNIENFSLLGFEATKNKCNIKSIKTISQTFNSFTVIVDIEFNNVLHIHNVMDSLESKETIHLITRLKI